MRLQVGVEAGHDEPHQGPLGAEHRAHEGDDVRVVAHLLHGLHLHIHRPRPQAQLHCDLQGQAAALVLLVTGSSGQVLRT